MNKYDPYDHIKYDFQNDQFLYNIPVLFLPLLSIIGVISFNRVNELIILIILLSLLCIFF